MVAAGRDAEDDAAVVEDGGDDGNVRQVAASGQLRVVAHQNLPLLQPMRPALPLRPVVELHTACPNLCESMLPMIRLTDWLGKCQQKFVIASIGAPLSPERYAR